MINFYHRTLNNPLKPRQLSFGKTLIAEFNCPLEKRLQDAWSHYNYIIYVIEGRKIWHTAHGSYDLRKGSCVFVRKGACIVEQFLDTSFCLIFVFLPDDFIYNVLKSKSQPVYRVSKKYNPVIALDNNEALDAFFHSMKLCFESMYEPEPALIELKFRELVLTIAGNPRNIELLSFFGSLINNPHAISLRHVMEENFCFNLRLEEFAHLSNRSLSSFKRDFKKEFNATPGKWLLEKRLQHAMNLISNGGKLVNEAAFESGFENLSHFSRVFRSHFGLAPASVKMHVAV